MITTNLLRLILRLFLCVIIIIYLKRLRSDYKCVDNLLYKEADFLYAYDHKLVEFDYPRDYVSCLMYLHGCGDI